MDRGDREHERDSSCGGWESLACCNGEGERFSGTNGPECNQCSNRSGGGTDAIKNKDCEIKAIPELLKLLDIKGSTVTTDAVGTQTQIMEQIFSQEGHILLMVKKNQPQSYEEILKYCGEMSDDHKNGERWELQVKIPSDTGKI